MTRQSLSTETLSPPPRCLRIPHKRVWVLLAALFDDFFIHQELGNDLNQMRIPQRHAHDVLLDILDDVDQTGVQ